MTQDSPKCRSWIAVAALAAMLGACGSSAAKDEKSAKSAAADPTDKSARAKKGDKSASEDTATAKAPAWEKIERVPFAKLQGLLPEVFGGLKRTDLGGSTNPDGERTYSEAVADYTGDDEVSVHLTIQDHPVVALETLPSKTASFEGYPVVAESEGGGAAELRLIVGGRFLVQANGNKRTVAQLKDSMKLLDLAKLASWKDEGVPKK